MSFELTLSQAELNKAIKNHVKTLGLNIEGKQIDVEFTATRKPAGYSALVTISDSDEKGLTALAPAKAGENIESTAVTPQAVFENQNAATEEEEEVDLPPVTPETPVGGKSLFDQE